jgi:hypothetical protein
MISWRHGCWVQMRLREALMKERQMVVAETAKHSPQNQLAKARRRLM